CAGDNRRFRDTRMLDKRALKLERAEPIVGALEDVVCAPDVGEIAVCIAVRYIAGAVITSCEALFGALGIIEIAGRQARGPRLALDRDLPVIGLIAVRIQQDNLVPW